MNANSKVAQFRQHCGRNRIACAMKETNSFENARARGGSDRDGHDGDGHDGVVEVLTYMRHPLYV
jgi:hypothetical protein